MRCNLCHREDVVVNDLTVIVVTISGLHTYRACDACAKKLKAYLNTQPYKADWEPTVIQQ